MGGQSSTYSLDLAGSLAQVLYDGETAYIYGLGRIAQQQGGSSEYFLIDALGSVRQLANAAGTLIYRQNFDPFGNLTGAVGQGGSSYGYAGEWTDGTGLQHLRARYYAPQQGRFVTRDPFPGMLVEPASLKPYAYALNSPVMYTDPSGEFPPVIAAMLISGAISGGIDIVTQLVQNSWNVHCTNWVQFAGAVGAGAIGGLIGFYVPAASAGITGLVKLMMLGGVGGAASGIGGRAVMTALSGDWSNWQEEIFSFKRVVADFAFGAAGGGIGFGARQLSDKIKVQPTRQPAKISRSSSTPDFYVTPDGTVLPSTKQGLLKNLDLFTVEGDKYYGFGSNGPIRIRLDLHGHPGSPDFSGPLNPFHETPHIHIEKRIHVISGKWIPQFTFPWDFFK